MTKTAFRMEAAAKINATFYPKIIDNRLRSSINARYRSGGPEVVLQAGGQSRGQTVNYAGFVEFGTKDPIKPRLFFDKKNKQYRYARKGIKPRFYLKRAVEKEQKRLPDDLRKMLKMALEPQ
jgi:hypothetical protein